jgi:hypothetical protein
VREALPAELPLLVRVLLDDALDPEDDPDEEPEVVLVLDEPDDFVAARVLELPLDVDARGGGAERAGGDA